MGRWRPPRKPASPYITAAGYRALEDELKALWPRRRDVVSALSAAAAEGDRSENAEYLYRKKELAGLDRRIRYLQKRIPVLRIVRHPSAPDGVFFGARVTLDTDQSGERQFRIVGEDEADASIGDVNIDSPLARAMLRKNVGDEIRVQTADGELVGCIVAIDYELEDG